jgi:hypothetical protein
VPSPEKPDEDRLRLTISEAVCDFKKSPATCDSGRGAADIHAIVTRSDGWRRMQASLCYYFHLKEVQMDRTVDVTIPVEPEAAAALADPRNLEAIGRLVSRLLRPRSDPRPPRSGDR